MGEQTKIEWVDHTFNPWIGCTRLSDACDNRYAAAMSHRRGWATFLPGAPRRRTAANWRQPLIWNRKAASRGVREKVFGPSLGDPFDAEVSDDWRRDYLELIEQTPWLDYILLTKRPQVAAKVFAGRPVPDNLWPGITAENQKMLELRAPAILSIAAKVHVLSAEPLLEPLAVSEFLGAGPYSLGWVITGGESGPKARLSHPDWFRSLRDQCRAAGVPFFFKQWGEWTAAENVERTEGTVRTARRVEDAWTFGRENIAGTDGHGELYRVGRKAAGARLDGREWREVPG